jgi:hypothetical protein
MSPADSRRRPLVALVHSVPLVSAALADVLQEVGDIRMFRAGADTAGLLGSLRPDAVVVDREAEAVVAGAFADETGAVAVFLSPRSGQVEVLGQITQDSVAIADASPEAVRNLLIGLLRAGEPAL